MTNSAPGRRPANRLANGLSGNCAASDLRVDDVIVVTRGRTYSRQKVRIVEINRNGRELRVDYVSLAPSALGEHGHVWTDEVERWTKVPA